MVVVAVDADNGDQNHGADESREDADKDIRAMMSVMIVLMMAIVLTSFGGDGADDGRHGAGAHNDDYS